MVFKRKSKGSHQKTRTITKTRTIVRRVGGGFKRHFGRSKSSVSGKSGHVVAISEGLAIGSSVSLVSNKVLSQAPIWTNPLVGFVTGLITGKITLRSWKKAFEVALVASGDAYLTDRVVRGEPIIPSYQSGGTTNTGNFVVRAIY